MQTGLEYTIFELAQQAQDEINKENYSSAIGILEMIKDLSK